MLAFGLTMLNCYGNFTLHSGDLARLDKLFVGDAVLRLRFQCFHYAEIGYVSSFGDMHLLHSLLNGKLFCCILAKRDAFC